MTGQEGAGMLCARCDGRYREHKTLREQNIFAFCTCPHEVVAAVNARFAAKRLTASVNRFPGVTSTVPIAAGSEQYFATPGQSFAPRDEART